jgi:hypothetical protein
MSKAVGIGDLNIDPEVSAHIKLSRSSVLNGTGVDEVAFAVEYGEVISYISRS